MGEKLTCPVCGVKVTYINNLITHINGAHIKKKEEHRKEIIVSIEQSDYNEDFKNKLIDQFRDNEPFFSEYDESIVDYKINTINENKNLLNNYFHPRNPICREERQYSFMLSKLLKSNNDEIKDKLGFNSSRYEVIQVYYEVTFMRDFWAINNKSKKEFNKLLFEYVDNYIEKEKIKKLGMKIGSKDTNHANYWSSTHPIAKWMMNAKPDIGVLLYDKQEDIIKLYFIECKYLSSVDKYEDKENDIESDQLFIQGLILDFLCENYKLKYKYNSNLYDVKKGDKVELVKFSLQEETNNGGAITICIDYLINKANINI